MDKQQSIRLRKKVQLLAKRGLNNSEIAKRLDVSRDFVIQWKKATVVEQDGRGWMRGKPRKYTEQQIKKVVEQRLAMEHKFFLGQKRLSNN